MTATVRQLPQLPAGDTPERKVRHAMTTWHEELAAGQSPSKWPYPLMYGRERKVETDVLVIGGGIAGCHAAINARRTGAAVTLLDKGAPKWSGNGGAGVDHWLAACTNPCSQVTPQAFTQRAFADSGGYDSGVQRYINAREGWDTLLDCESMGVQIRDLEGEFEGAAFRDPQSGLLFAYDYVNRTDIRVYGFNMKPSLHREMKRLKVDILDRVMVTALLTAGEGPTKCVAGAIGLHTRSGEIVVVAARATVLATGLPGRLWTFSAENRPTFRDPNLTGDGAAAAWNAGAAFVNLESSYPDGSPLSYLAYGVGNAHNTWHGCSIVDADGKEVPWVDRDGNELETIAERFQPSPGQDFMLGHGQRIPVSYENHVKELAPDLPERIRSGEFRLPLYADLTRLPETERRAIFGLMVGNEGRTRIPVYEALTRAGFDPDQDLLQVPVMDPPAYGHANFWAGMPVPYWRQWGTGGLLVDWNLGTNLAGLFAAGGAVYGGGAHSSAAASGRYAGRNAAAYARTAEAGEIDQRQVEHEKQQLYAPLEGKARSLGWKELNAGICKLMQDYCGAYRTAATLEIGLDLLRGLRESEATRVLAANPHELARAAECRSLLGLGEAVIQASLARQASSRWLNFQRLDFPSSDPQAWNKLIPLQKSRDGYTAGELALDYHLQPPYANEYEENYRRHSAHPAGEVQP